MYNHKFPATPALRSFIECYFVWEGDALEPALEGVSINLIDHYYNENLTSIATRADVTLMGPKITLRVFDRFVVDEERQITEQENHFDASPLRG